MWTNGYDDDASIAHNDTFLRQSFRDLVDESAGLPPDQRLVMYDACDVQEVKAAIGPYRKRLDSRRNTKPKKPDDQRLVCTPFDAGRFHFGKISNERERLLRLDGYEVLTNKFPLFRNHMVLAARALVPQQMTLSHLQAVSTLLHRCSFCAYFNSWMASASINHFHCHLVDETPPVAALPLEVGALVDGVRCLRPRGFDGECYVFPAAQLAAVDAAVRAMQAVNQPHNLLFTRRHVYVFPKPLARPARSAELYPETVGGPELLGSFTVYTDADYARLDEAAVCELLRINTAPLPAWMLGGGEGATGRELGAPAAKRARGVSWGESAPLGVALERSVSFELVSF